MNPRKAAVLAAERVLSQGAYSNLVWRTALDDVPPAERPFATALFYGTLERAYSLGLALRGYLTQPPSKLDSLTRAVLLTGMYQLAFMNIPGHAAVSETVAICRSVGRSRQSGFVNGVLRAFLRDGAAIPAPADPTDALAAAYCHFLQTSRPQPAAGASTHSWAAFARANADRVITGRRGAKPISENE